MTKMFLRRLLIENFLDPPTIGSGCGVWLRTLMSPIDDNEVLNIESFKKKKFRLFLARDVVGELVKAKISSPLDFKWISQLRYFYQGDKLHVCMITTDLLYGCEYLGNSARLVITPLTDRYIRDS